MNIKTLILRSAKHYGDKTALVDGGNRFSFRETNERSTRLSNAFLDLGARHGERMVFLGENCFQHIETRFAAHKIGLVFISLSTRSNAEEVAYAINDSQTRILVASEDQLSKIDSVRSQIPGVRSFVAATGESEGWRNYEDLVTGGSSLEPEAELTDEEVGRIVYTGGTTGRPKGILLRRGSYLAIARNLLLDSVPGLNDQDVFLGLQPLYHAAGAFIMPCWIRGVRQVITSSYRPESVLPLIERERVTVIKTVPTVLGRLVNHPDLNKVHFGSVRILIYGASPMPVEQLKEAIRVFGPVLLQNYGQSEAPMTISVLRPDEHVLEGSPDEVARLASVGRPYTYVEVRIVDDDGRDVADGQTGELVVRGDHTMMGYLNNPEKTAETLKDGWIYTGDVGRKDREGFIFLTDRKGEMIVSGGLNVYPGEVEQVLYRHPAVLEAGVFGVPDDHWGEAVKAVVALKAGMTATEEELVEFCKQRLDGYKKPQSVDFMESLPKSGAGKILRRELREPYWEGRDRRIH